MDNWTGKTIDGRYLVQRLIGEGGMGVVLHARHQFTGADVAVKMLHPELRMRDELAHRFLAEARAPAAIGHPGIVAINDAGIAPTGELYLVMELLRGETLGKKIERGQIPLLEAQRIALEVLEALAAAHAANIVHRDLKPENVFLTAPNGTAKVLDFGIAKMMTQSGRTAAGAVIGTIDYMSPEQVRDTSSVDQRTDLWAVGVIFYEMITGKRPYEADSFAEYLQKLYSTTPRPIAELIPGAPAAVEGFVRRALAVDPAHRFASAGEMAAALRQLIARPTDVGVAKTAVDMDSLVAQAAAQHAQSKTIAGAPLTGDPQASNYPPAPSPAATFAAAPLPHASATQPAPYPPAPQAVYAQTQGPQPYMHVPQGAYPAPPSPAPSKLGLYIAIGVGILVLVGGGFAMLGGVVYLMSMGEPKGGEHSGPEPDQPVPASNAATCKMACARLQTCGGIDPQTCAQDCEKDAIFGACAQKAEDTCNGMSACALSAFCAGTMPKGTRTCHETANCQANCNAEKMNDMSCLCGCMGSMSPDGAHDLLVNNLCIISKCSDECGQKGNWGACFQCYGRSCNAESKPCLGE
jgi:serine/threonine-protein kinase